MTKYAEVQRPAAWVYVINVLAVGLGWWAFVQQILLGRPWGDDPGPDWGVWGMWVVLGVLLPVFILRVRLVVTVDDKDVVIRFAPVWTRRVARADIASCEVRDVRPVLQYGGWGIRYGGRARGWAYTIRGSEGVFLELRDGKRLLIGSDEPRALLRALTE